MKDIVIIDGVRTPYAKVGTALKDVPADSLGAFVIKEIDSSRESLTRSLSAEGNPRQSTLVAVLRVAGLNLSVRPAA